VKIRIVYDFPYQVLGEDLKVYGPFTRGSIVVVPDRLAKILIVRGIAEEVRADGILAWV